MKKMILLFLMLPMYFIWAQQAPGIEWEKSLGGSNVDQAYSIVNTSDGGSVIAGRSNSTDGDVSDLNGGFDYWVVKLNASGNIIWQKTFGGTGTDAANSIIQTSDGGYAVAGSSNSGNGDITAPQGGNDYWIIKLDANGNIVWQKSYGGNGSDEAQSIIQTSDGGYLVVGNSDSQSGNITNPNGGVDYWIIKLDTNGNLVWQKSYGGTGADYAYSTVQSADGNYLVAGYTNSQDGDVSLPKGSDDYWVIKIDTLGNLLWEKSYGGAAEDYAFSIVNTNDGGFAVTGVSNSTDGNITTNIGNFDVWVIKSDSLGNIVWQKNYGGTADEYGVLTKTNIKQLVDGSLSIVGVTASNNGDLQYNNGLTDIFVFNVSSSNGTINWSRVLGGSASESGQAIAQTADGKLLVSGFSNSQNIDITNPKGNWDMWVVKLGEPIEIDSLTVSTVNNVSSDIYPEQSIQLQALITPQYAIPGVTWSVISGGEFVSVAGTGVLTVTGIEPGTAIIRATSVDDSSSYDEITINVLTPQWNQVGATFLADWPSQIKGESVDISADGSTVIIGAPNNTTFFEEFGGAAGASVYEYIVDEWIQKGQTIQASTNIYATGVARPRAGAKVAISADGNIIAISEPHYQYMEGNEVLTHGRVRIFEFDDNEWVQIGDDIFGYNDPFIETPTFAWGGLDLSADGSIVAIGGIQRPDQFTSGINFGGQARVFKNINGQWTQQGATFLGTTQSQYLGQQLSLSGDGSILAVASPSKNNGDGQGAGFVEVFEFSEEDSEWNSIGEFEGEYYGNLWGFIHYADNYGGGLSLSYDGNTLAIGGRGSYTSGDSSGGKVDVFNRTGTTWSQIGNSIIGNEGQRYGSSVSLSKDGTILALGAAHSTTGNDQVRVYKNISNEWQLIDNPILGGNGGFGYDVALSSDGSGLIIGHDRALSNGHYAGGQALYYKNCNLAQIEVSSTSPSEAVACQGNPITLSADALASWYNESATFNWYTSVDDTESIFTGKEFTTPVITETTSYWVEAVTPTGCVSERIEITVTLGTIPALTIEEKFPVFCANTEIEISGTTTDGNIIVWYDSADADQWVATGTTFINAEGLTESGSYWVQAYNPVTHCASEKEEIQITIIPAPEAPEATSPQGFTEGNVLNQFVVTPQENLRWYADPELTQQLDGDTPIVDGTTYYVVQVIDGCIGEPTAIVADASLSTSEFENQHFVYYPNPVTNQLYFDTNERIQTIQVFDVNGRLVIEKSQINGIKEVDLSQLAQGSYVIRTITEIKERTFKVIKR